MITVYDSPAARRTRDSGLRLGVGSSFTEVTVGTVRLTMIMIQITPVPLQFGSLMIGLRLAATGSAAEPLAP